VCRFEPENHVREIIEGFLASKSRASLVLVGDHTRDNPYIQSLLRHQDGRILFAGPIYDKSRIQALRFFCRAYLHGHSVGGTNPSLLEAMGCSSVVIAHDNPFNARCWAIRQFSLRIRSQYRQQSPDLIPAR
jgi:glycosyltransferase involved in cell wall biosynthesis